MLKTVILSDNLLMLINIAKKKKIESENIFDKTINLFRSNFEILAN